MKIQKTNTLGTNPYMDVVAFPTPEIVRVEISKMEWRELSGFRVNIDDYRWMEFTGSESDGYALNYSDGKMEWMNKNSVESLEEGILAMESFASGGEEWHSMFEWEEFNKVTEDYVKGRSGLGCMGIVFVLTIPMGLVMAIIMATIR